MRFNTEITIGVSLLILLVIVMIGMGLRIQGNMHNAFPTASSMCGSYGGNFISMQLGKRQFYCYKDYKLLYVIKLEDAVIRSKSTKIN